MINVNDGVFDDYNALLFPGQRYMVIDELISTESKYINNLNTILSVFLPAFEHVVAPRDLRLLIPAQLEMLLEAHQGILESLKQRMSSQTKFYGFVGDIFSRLCGHSNVSVLVCTKNYCCYYLLLFCCYLLLLLLFCLQMEFFNMYSVYMGEFKIAMRTLESYQKDSVQFREILRLLQQSPLCERLSLASYLLTPIQRLPRYELLLKVSSLASYPLTPIQRFPHYKLLRGSQNHML